MKQDSNPSGDPEMRAVLAHASAPPLPAGAVDRLMARIATEPRQAGVMPFAPRPRAPRAAFWRHAAAPLAASLALGVWLGASGRVDFVLPNAVTGGVALIDDAPVDDLGGVGDAYAGEGLT